MKKIPLLLILTSFSLGHFVEAEELLKSKPRKYKMRAGESYFSKYDRHNGIKNSDADIEFDVHGLNIQLKGYSQERANPFYYEELIDPTGNQN